MRSFLLCSSFKFLYRRLVNFPFVLPTPCDRIATLLILSVKKNESLHHRRLSKNEIFHPSESLNHSLNNVPASVKRVLSSPSSSSSLSCRDDVYIHIFVWTCRIFVRLFRETERRNGCVANPRERERGRVIDEERHRQSKIDSIVKSKLQGNEQLAGGSRD